MSCVRAEMPAPTERSSQQVRAPGVGRCSDSSDSAATGCAERCARTAPVPRRRRLLLRLWSSSQAVVLSGMPGLPGGGSPQVVAPGARSPGRGCPPRRSQAPVGAGRGPGAASVVLGSNPRARRTSRVGERLDGRRVAAAGAPGFRLAGRRAWCARLPASSGSLANAPRSRSGSESLRLFISCSSSLVIAGDTPPWRERSSAGDDPRRALYDEVRWTSCRS